MRHVPKRGQATSTTRACVTSSSQPVERVIWPRHAFPGHALEHDGTRRRGDVRAAPGQVRSQVTAKGCLGRFKNSDQRAGSSGLTPLLLRPVKEEDQRQQGQPQASYYSLDDAATDPTRRADASAS